MGSNDAPRRGQATTLPKAARLGSPEHQPKVRAALLSVEVLNLLCWKFRDKTQAPGCKGLSGSRRRRPGKRLRWAKAGTFGDCDTPPPRMPLGNEASHGDLTLLPKPGPPRDAASAPSVVHLSVRPTKPQIFTDRSLPARRCSGPQGQHRGRQGPAGSQGHLRAQMGGQRAGQGGVGDRMKEQHSRQREERAQRQEPEGVGTAGRCRGWTRARVLG